MKHAKRTKVRTLWLLAAIITTIGFAALSLTGCRSHDDSGPIGITSAVITVTAPVTGAAPSATANGVGSFAIGPVPWSPAVSGTFAAETAYTAGVTLTANSGYTFKGLANASINGNTAAIIGNTGSAVTLTFTFPATLGEPVEEFTITFDQLQNHAPALTLLSLKLVGSAQEKSGAITIANADGYESIQWLYNGAAITAEHPVNGAVISAGTLTITSGTAAASAFNSVGDYYITLEAVKDGRRYSAVITVTVTL